MCGLCFDSEDDLEKALRLSEQEARQREEEQRRAAAYRQPEPDLFDFNAPAVNPTPQMYMRQDSMGSFGNYYPQQQQGYQLQQGFGNELSGVQFGQPPVPQQLQQQQSFTGNPFGANPFGAAFDGGAGSRPLPHQVGQRGSKMNNNLPHLSYHSFPFCCIRLPEEHRTHKLPPSLATRRKLILSQTWLRAVPRTSDPPLRIRLVNLHLHLRRTPLQH